jgi:hypothetical protein
MNTQVQPDISGAALPCLFKAGQFVRLGENVGRVIEDTEAKGFYTRVQMFDDPNGRWGRDGKASFGPGCLRLLVDAPSLDLEKVSDELMKLIAVSDLANGLGIESMRDDENLRSHFRLIGSIVADRTCNLLDMISDEDRRQKQVNED